MTVKMNFDINWPLFIAIDGVDGLGKSTQAQLLASEFIKENIAASITAEAKGTPLADVIRSEYLSGKRQVDNMVNAFSFTADRYDRFTNEDGMLARLANNEVVIADRFLHSSMVYSALGVDNRKNAQDVMKLMYECNIHLIRMIRSVCKHCIAFVLLPSTEMEDELLRRIAARDNSPEIYENKELLCRGSKLMRDAIDYHTGECMTNQLYDVTIPLIISPFMDIKYVRSKILQSIALYCNGFRDTSWILGK